MIIDISDNNMYFLRKAVSWRMKNIDWALNQKKYPSERAKQALLTERRTLDDLEKTLYFEK